MRVWHTYMYINFIKMADTSIVFEFMLIKLLIY